MLECLDRRFSAAARSSASSGTAQPSPPSAAAKYPSADTRLNATIRRIAISPWLWM